MRRRTTLDSGSLAYLDRVAEAVEATVGHRLVGLYLHWSAVLGGFDPRRSDIDLVAVTRSSLPDSLLQQLGARVDHAVLPCPAAELELVVMSNGSVAAPERVPRVDLYLETGRRAGGRRPSLHADLPQMLFVLAVCRDRGAALRGPPPDAVFGAVPMSWLLAAVNLPEGWRGYRVPPEFWVLNACRAVVLAEEGRLCSKIEGGRWALDRWAHRSVIEAALSRHVDGADRPIDGEAVDGFLESVRRRVGLALRRT